MSLFSGASQSFILREILGVKAKDLNRILIVDLQMLLPNLQLEILAFRVLLQHSLFEFGHELFDSGVEQTPLTVWGVLKSINHSLGF